MKSVAKKSKDIPNILLVQHDAKDRHDLSSILRRNSFLPVAVENGTHALNLLEAEQFSALLIVDEVEDLSAEELILLATEIGPTLKVFYLHKEYNEADRKRFLDLGVVEYLENSTNRNLVINSLKKYI